MSEGLAAAAGVLERKSGRILRPLALGQRLETALKMTLPAGDTACVADIGCDHGRLIVTMLERMPLRTGIAADISAPSLEKTRMLAQRRGTGDRLSVRLGAGLSVLEPDEADAVILCGMGGELIAELLEKGETVLKGVKRIVCQPMRGTEELRRFLWENGWSIEEDVVVQEGRRLYEVLSARPPQSAGSRQLIPVGFPENFFSIGFIAAKTGEENVKKLVSRQLAQVEKRLKTAAGTRGEAILIEKKTALETVLKSFFPEKTEGR